MDWGELQDWCNSVAEVQKEKQPQKDEAYNAEFEELEYKNRRFQK